MKTILVDVDHTIMDAFNRDGMIGVNSWDEYHAASVHDSPFQHTIDLLNALAATGYTIIGLTARPEKWRKLTMEIMLKHNVTMHELLMRPEEEFRPAPQIKLQLAQNRFGPDLAAQVAFVIDDREDVIAAFQSIGISGLVIHGKRAICTS